MDPIPVPTFSTARLHIRPLGEADEALYRHLYTDPEVMRHIAAPLSDEAVQRNFRVACRQAGGPSASMRIWVMSERDSSMDIGILALMRHRDTTDALELGAMLVAAGQGRGLAVEAQSALLDRLFSVPGVRLVWSRNAPDNGAVVGVRLKMGFTRVETAETGCHEIRWEMTREQWLARPREARRVVIAVTNG